MFCTTKKVLCYTAITSILNLSFQPAYAGKSDLPLASEEISYTRKVSHHLTKKGLHKERMSDPGLEDPQTNPTRVSQTTEADVVSKLFLAPLKTMMGAVSLVKQGVRFALENPRKAITVGLLLQARTATSTLSLSSLMTSQGFTITGAVKNDQSGYSVSSAGDFNGDGLSDVIIGAYAANNYAGQSYVIYGTNSSLSSLNLSSLTPNQGFTINGAVIGDDSGHSVSSAGDFNGDGLSDVIIGAYRANNQAGESYVIYGTKTLPSSLNLSSLTLLQGFNITGASTDVSGWSVSSAGDFNGDGLYDVIVGVPNTYTSPYAGKSYVIYGTKTPPSSINLSSLTPNQGFNITGAAPGDNSGYSVSSAGDFNGDGLDDLIIGAPYIFPYANYYVGRSYVIYGTNSTPPSISLSSLMKSQGFTITGAAKNDQSGQSVSSAGDFNGDGLSDVIIGACWAKSGANLQAGKSYIIYGTNSTPSPISLSSLTPLQGFTISGSSAWDESGYSVSAAGDFNGDGLSDVIIGAPGNYYTGSAGESYVIYGTKTPSSSISLSSLTPLQGFNITGASADVSGWSVSSAGDFNGDGLCDVIIGAPGANGNAGKSYVIYGHTSITPTTSLISTTASPTSTVLETSDSVQTSQMSSSTPASSFVTSGNPTSEGIGTSVSASMSQVSSTDRISSSSVNTAINPTTENFLTSQMNSIVSTPSSIIASSNPTSEPESSRMTSSSSILPSTPPFSPPVQHSSSENSKGMSWETIAAISGGVGGAFVAGVVGTIIVKKCCFSKKKNSGYARLENLEEAAETPTT